MNTNYSKSQKRLAIKLLLPSAVILVLIAFYPLGQVFYTSFMDARFASGSERTFTGVGNYIRLFSENREFITAIGNTMLFTFIAVFLETVLGLGMALAVNSRIPGKGIFRAVVLIPWAVITVVSARIWQWILDPTRMGLAGSLLGRIKPAWGQLSYLTTDHFQLPALILVDVWKTTPFMALIMLAGLQLVPRELYKAAAIDGAGKVRQFLYITLPLIRHSIVVALVFRTLDSLRVFDLFQVLLSGQKHSMASYTYEQLIYRRDMGLASAASVIIFLIIAAFSFSYIKLLKVEPA